MTVPHGSTLLDEIANDLIETNEQTLGMRLPDEALVDIRETIRTQLEQVDLAAESAILLRGRTKAAA